MITILGEVTSSKNSKRIVQPKGFSRPMLISSSQHMKYAKIALPQLEAQLPEWKRMIKNMKPPYRVVFFFYRATERRFDYLNLTQGIADLMVKAGYMEDDCMLYFIPSFAGWSKDKDNPRIVLNTYDTMLK